MRLEKKNSKFLLSRDLRKFLRDFWTQRKKLYDGIKFLSFY